MKKLKLKIAMVAVVAAVAGYGVYQNQTKEIVSELTLANIEALAAGESGKVVCLNMLAPCENNLLGPYLTYIN